MSACAKSNVFSEVYLDPGALAASMATDVRAGLTGAGCRAAR